MKRCVIFAAQPVTEELRQWCDGASLIIAADAGYRNARALGVEPDLLLGDYDSAPPPQTGKTVCLPTEKDDTDTFYAARQALAQGCGEVVILGGLGGRMDHTLANLHTLVFLARHGVRAVLADEKNEITVLLPGCHRLPARPGWHCSLLPAGGEARGVTLQHLKYPLTNAVLTNAWPVGVSNEFAGPEAVVEFRRGALYWMLCKD